MNDIWECDEQDARRWEEDPARAARLVYLRLQMHWHEQTAAGVYEGIPHFESARGPRPPATPKRRVRPDESGGTHEVPEDVRASFRKLIA